MALQLTHSGHCPNVTVNITGSKSESNRALILQALYGGFNIKNLSNSDDTRLMQKALASSDKVVDIHHAGTAMRFLTAYYAIQKGRETLLTGSSRMQERPIHVLVDALNNLGADITYAGNVGYPPLRMNGKALIAKTVALKANVSSQYISALMLIGAALPEGLCINLEGKITSTPYILMTAKLLERIGIEVSFEGQQITVQSFKKDEKTTIQYLTIESDWSSASYYYSIAALFFAKSEITPPTLTLSSYTKQSRQGDAALQTIYRKFGVVSHFEEDRLMLTKDESYIRPEQINLDLSDTPDIAQTIVVSCLGLGISCHITGLHTLRIKETDRLEALKNEVAKLGGKLTITQDTLNLEASKTPLRHHITIKTYNDHRMAMAFAPLALYIPIAIADADVVSKSYPGFWQDLSTLGFQIDQ